MTLVHTEVHEAVATVTLDDPARRNALSLELVEELETTFDWLEANDEVRAVVVTGAGSAFCAGADLSHLGASREDGLRRIYEGFLRLARCPLPTVAAVNGPAVGAGMNLALAADLRVAGRSARFDTRFVALGIHPGGGHTWMLRRIVGPQAAAALVVFGQVADGPEAERIGLAWRCVADDALIGTAHDLAAGAAAGPPELVQRVKATLAQMADVATHDEAVDAELVPQVWSMDQPAFAERLAALQQRITSTD